MGVFISDASNLVPGDTNDRADVFVRDLRMGTTARVSLGPAGGQLNRESRGASITPTGSFVSFSAVTAELMPREDIFLRGPLRGP